jgi:predicted transcriptional regulator
MYRITVRLEDETRIRLRRIAAERNISVTELVRQAIDAAIERHAPRPHSLGVGASGVADTARRSGDEPARSALR